MREIQIGTNEADQRMDRFLLKYFNNSSRTNVYKLIRKKVFKVNGERKKEDYFLKNGDVIQVYLSDESFDALVKEEEVLAPVQVDIDIVFEDDNILIVNKPKGLLTHPDKNEFSKTLATKVQHYLKHLSTRTFKPAPIQRLDKNTSGLVTFAKNYETLKKLNAQMRDRSIRKFYQCVVLGDVKQAGEVKGWLLKDEGKNKVRMSKTESPGSKACHTKYKPIERKGTHTLVEVELMTGRTHQIRASMAWIGHPIVGDPKYGTGNRKNVRSQLLHGYKIVIDGQTYIHESAEIRRYMDSGKNRRQT